MPKITHNTAISIGLVMTFLGVVFSAGILYNQVDVNKQELHEFKSDTKDQFASLNFKVDSLIRMNSARQVSSSDDTKQIQ